MKKKLEGGDLRLHSQFEKYGTNAKEWMEKCVLLLPEIERREVWRKKGFGSIYEYAAKLAGMNRNKVNEALRVLSKTEDKLALRQVIEKKGINAVKPVVTIATHETQEFWAEKATNMSKNELETYVRDFRKQANGSEGLPRKASQPAKITVSMELEPEMVEQLEKLKGDGTWEEAMQKLFQARQRELERDKPEPVKTSSKHVPVEIDRFVLERDCSRCVFPGCNKCYDELHHADGFARVQVHDPDRIFCLCKAHHSLAHQGLIENEYMFPQFWRVREQPDRAEPRFGLDKLVVKHKQLGLV